MLSTVFGDDLRGGRQFRTARSQWRTWRKGRESRGVDDTSGGRSLSLSYGNKIGIRSVGLSGKEKVGMDCVPEEGQLVRRAVIKRETAGRTSFSSVPADAERVTPEVRSEV